MRCAVLISGGVDSSVALALLQRQGYQVKAYYLKIWLENELSFLGTCPWQEDLSFVESVCDVLNVPLEVISLQREYRDYIIADTIAQIKAGYTPNPDMLCNPRIKFGAFLGTVGADYSYVASGHYAQVIHEKNISRLYCSPDPIKDQTYFLSQLTQEQLKKTLFPLGSFTKSEVRMYAHHYNIPTKDRKDSQGLCFLGKIKFPDFVRAYLGEHKGHLIEWETGAVKGEHAGYWFYTIGQRKAIGLAGGPWYVVGKNSEKNEVYISSTYYAADKNRKNCIIGMMNWLSYSLTTPQVIDVKIRHGVLFHKALITPLADGLYSLSFTDNDQGIAPGQYAVLYKNRECLGGGIIQGENEL